MQTFHTRRLAIPRAVGFAAAIGVILSPAFVIGQNSLFTFDPNGNLLTQSAENLAAPQILAQPQVQVVRPGELASFFVVAADTSGLTYQWRFNGTTLPAATADTLLLANVGATNEGQYSVVLVNGSGSVTSAPAALMLDSRGSSMPDSWQLTYFGNLNQTANGDFDGDGVSNLQEFLDGTNPTNSASALYRLAVLSDGESVVVVPNLPGYTNGQVVTLTATDSPPAVFHAWTGDMVTRSNTITLTMTNNKAEFAHFLPMDFVWLNSGGDWSVAANWNPSLVPGSNDNVTVNLSVTLNTNADCGSLTLGVPSGNPALSGTGTLTLHGASSWGSGAMDGSGRTVIAPGATLTLTSASSAFWNMSSRVLENGGTILWTGAGTISLGVGVVITNRPGALFDARNAGTVSYAAGAVCRFDNAGTFRKSFNPGTNTFGSGVSFNNYGTVDLQTGTLVLGGGGVNNGTISVPANTSLNLSGGTFNSSSPSSLTGAGNFTVSGGAATLAGLVNVSGTNIVSAGTANFTGNTICTNNVLLISGGTANFDGTGTVSPAVLNLSGGTLAGGNVVSVLNVLNWTGGTMSGTGRTLIAPGATFNLANANSVTLDTRTLENAGTALWTGNGGLRAYGAVITNRLGALFEAQNNASFTYVFSGACRFDNAGTFRKDTSTGTTTFSSLFSFNNYGTVDIQTGTLLCIDSFLNNGAVTLSAGATNQLTGGGSANGSFTASATALVDWTGGTFTLNPGAQLNGAGLYRINGATLTCNQDIVVANLGLLNGTLGGSGAVTVNSVVNWTTGTMNGTGRTIIAPGATLNINNPGSVSLSSRSLENGGTALWTGAGSITLGSGAVITNRSGALFNAQNAAALSYASGAVCRFDNAGTFRKDTSAGTTTFGFNVSLNNYGTVDLQTGTLLCNDSFLNNGAVTLSAGATNQLASGGSANGSFTASPTALVDWTGGTFTLNPAAQLNGAGLYYINGATLTCNQDIVVANLGLLNGTLGGSGAVTVNSVMNWTAGTMNGTGRTIIAPVAALNINNPGSVSLSSRSLENGGTALWTGAGSITLGSGAVITNRSGALFNAQNAAALSYASGAVCRFDNAGTFRKSFNLGTNTFGFNVSLNNYGTVDVQTGILAANGGYTSAAGATLSSAIGGTSPGTGYGQLQVAGTVTLNGALSVLLTNGYVPTTNDSFTVLTAGTRNGTFANFYYPSNAVTLQLSNTANSVIVRVTAVAPRPTPFLLSASLSGSNVMLTWTAVSNTTYRVEFNPDLTSSNWSALPGDVTNLSNLASKLDPLTPSNRFYRVHVLP